MTAALFVPLPKGIAEDLGFSCVEAEDGSKAYESCQQSMPDAILEIEHMPVMTGIEFLEKLRQMENGDHPKVIFCTTENDMEHIQRAMHAGANEYIMKPFDSDIIKSKFTQIGLLS